MRKLKQEREKWQVGWRMRWAFGGPERPPEEYFGGRDTAPEYFGWRGYAPTAFGWQEPAPPPRYFGYEDYMKLPFGARPQFPPVDMYEEDGKLVIIADIPGFDKDEIKIEVKPNQLVISGDRRKRISEEIPEENVYRFERYFDKFSRTIYLPFEVNPDSAKAKYEKGTVTITLEKAEYEKGKEVPIE
ncbi:Hsp20/alpha crystallin family protein [Thermosulfidibacter takaii]|nr:Hsp20/alpha crystallin family protein [Thermosulfidibacter takaii]